MMDERVRTLLNQITELEDELRNALHDQQTQVLYRIEGKRIEFEQGIREAQAKLRQRVPKWIAESKLRNVVSAPVIYSLIVPLVLLDLALTIFQTLCFPLYRIAPVKRSDYVLFDRLHLSYLNSIEKFNCVYCAYAAGVIAYAREIAARTEQYWCPIKHARKVMDPHRRYARYADFADAEHYHDALVTMREELETERAGEA
ncbi:MAG: hypothetical protein ACU85U_06590 [Gammaproteobacteria bacterium]|jgi:hypothetical protein